MYKACRVADWFAQLNNKMGGDLNKIQTVGKVMHMLGVAAMQLNIVNDAHRMKTYALRAVHD